MAQHPAGAVVSSGGSGTETEAKQVGDEQLGSAGSQQRGQPPEFQKGTVEAVQQEHRWPFAQHGYGPGAPIAGAQAGQLPPLHLGRQGPALGIEQAARRFAHQLLLGGSQGVQAGWRSLLQVLTRAASRSEGPTAKGRRCRSESARQAKAQACSSS